MIIITVFCFVQDLQDADNKMMIMCCIKILSLFFSRGNIIKFYLFHKYNWCNFYFVTSYFVVIYFDSSKCIISVYNLVNVDHIDHFLFITLKNESTSESFMTSIHSTYMQRLILLSKTIYILALNA